MSNNNNNYESWYMKWHNWTDGEHSLAVKKFDWSDAHVNFTMSKKGRTEDYKFGVEHVCAIAADGASALPSFLKEDEVDKTVESFLYHGRNLFLTK